jgi:hypothetical protein
MRRYGRLRGHPISFRPPGLAPTTTPFTFILPYNVHDLDDKTRLDYVVSEKPHFALPTEVIACQHTACWILDFTQMLRQDKNQNVNSYKVRCG